MVISTTGAILFLAARIFLLRQAARVKWLAAGPALPHMSDYASI